MRCLALVLVTGLCACGGPSGGHGAADSAEADAPADANGCGSNAPVPHVIPGGGVADGPIAGPVHVYAIDDATRMPIAGAAVSIGSSSGTTDATGLVTASCLTGAQDVVVTASGYRTEAWLGANGANITIDLRPVQSAPPPSANLGGTVDLSSFSVGSGHTLAAIATYSQDDNFGDPANTIATANGANVCVVSAPPASQSCAFTVTSRTGSVALIAEVVDQPGSGAGSARLLGWAYLTGLTVVAGADQTGLALDVVAGSNTRTESFQFALPSFGGTGSAVAGIDLGSDGVLPMPIGALPPAPAPGVGSGSLLVPDLSLFPGATYSFEGLYRDFNGLNSEAESAVLVSGQAGTTIVAGAPVASPTVEGVSLTQAMWTQMVPDTGLLVSSVEYLQGSNHLLNILSFATQPAGAQNSNSVDVPAAVTLTNSAGVVTLTVSALTGTLDPTSFSFDRDLDTLTSQASQTARVPSVVTVSCTGVTPAATVSTPGGAFQYVSVPAGSSSNNSAIKLDDVVEFMPSGSFVIGPDPTAPLTDAGLVAPEGTSTCLEFTAPGTFTYESTIFGFTGSVTVSP